MRSTKFLAGLIILAMAGSAATAQSRIYSAGSSDHQRAAANGRGNLTSPSSQSSANPTSPAVASAAANSSRPIFRTGNSDHDRDRFDRDHDRDMHRHRNSGQSAIYPYSYYDYPPSDAANYSDQQEQPTEQAAQPQAPAPTIFENRPGYTPPPIKSYQHTMDTVDTGSSAVAPYAEQHAQQPSDNGQRTSAADPQPTTILVFRDGHQIEIGNYAIVGDTLYNIEGGNDTHKILLADLDLDKTIKANQARGYDFKLPKRQGS